MQGRAHRHLDGLQVQVARLAPSRKNDPQQRVCYTKGLNRLEVSLLSFCLTALPLAFFFLEGLTLVCLIGTALLWAVFGFLYVAEKKLKKQ